MVPWRCFCWSCSACDECWFANRLYGSRACQRLCKPHPDFQPSICILVTGICSASDCLSASPDRCRASRAPCPCTCLSSTSVSHFPRCCILASPSRLLIWRRRLRSPNSFHCHHEECVSSREDVAGPRRSVFDCSWCAANSWFWHTHHASWECSGARPSGSRDASCRLIRQPGLNSAAPEWNSSNDSWPEKSYSLELWPKGLSNNDWKNFGSLTQRHST